LCFNLQRFFFAQSRERSASAEGGQPHWGDNNSKQKENSHCFLNLFKLHIRAFPLPQHTVHLFPMKSLLFYFHHLQFDLLSLPHMQRKKLGRHIARSLLKDLGKLCAKMGQMERGKLFIHQQKWNGRRSEVILLSIKVHIWPIYGQKIVKIGHIQYFLTLTYLLAYFDHIS
jgi:hypothetical protein